MVRASKGARRHEYSGRILAMVVPPYYTHVKEKAQGAQFRRLVVRVAPESMTASSASNA
jgi:L-lysine 2,3-aminomutase